MQSSEDSGKNCGSRGSRPKSCHERLMKQSFSIEAAGNGEGLANNQCSTSVVRQKSVFTTGKVKFV